VVTRPVVPIAPNRLLVPTWLVAPDALVAAMGLGVPPETIGVLRPLPGASIA